MKERQFQLWRWTPVIIASFLMAAIALICLHTMKELREAVYWRERTTQTLLDTQGLEDSLMDSEIAEHKYARTGEPKQLIEYRQGTNAEMRDLTELNALAKGDPEQQKRLHDLTAAIQSVFAHDAQVIGVYARQGALKRVPQSAPNDSEDISDAALQELEHYSAEEKNLLVKRDAKEQDDYHRATHTLIGASFVAALLLVIANYVAGRELERRRAAETKQRELIADLQKALAEVKTLSGLIPMCSWCKSIRSDSGFWESVEKYMRSHTNAELTHSLCPACSQKLETELNGPQAN